MVSDILFGVRGLNGNVLAADNYSASIKQPAFHAVMNGIIDLQPNKSLKPTVTRVTRFAEMANPAPRYSGLVPPFHIPLTASDKSHKLYSTSHPIS